jgi:uncharacterized membrane protein
MARMEVQDRMKVRERNVTIQKPRFHYHFTQQEYLCLFLIRIRCIYFTLWKFFYLSGSIFK